MGIGNPTGQFLRYSYARSLKQSVYIYAEADKNPIAKIFLRPLQNCRAYVAEITQKNRWNRKNGADIAAGAIQQSSVIYRQ